MWLLGDGKTCNSRIYACSVNDTPNLGRYVACLETVKPVTAGYMTVV